MVFSCKEIGQDIYSEITRDTDWKAANRQSKPVRLVLDGIDEGFLRQPDYFAHLKRALSNIRSENPSLRLLLTSRPAELDSDVRRGRLCRMGW